VRDAKAKEYVDLAVNGTGRVWRMTDDILAYSKMIRRASC